MREARLLEVAAPTAVCGHSLGGALAQVVSQQRGATGVSLNGPFMGDIRGAVPMSSAGLIDVNAIGNPLSLATRTLRQIPHGREFTVTLPPFPEPPASLFGSVPSWMTLVNPLLRPPVAADSAVFYTRTLRYLAEAMLYHHSIDSLAAAIDRQARFAATLASTLAAR